MGAKYRLKLKSLRFVSPVDQPAQETAKVVLTKRSKGFRFTKDVEIVKVDEEMGLVFGWALTDHADGEEYFDLQGDNVVADDGLIKAAKEWVESGARSDEMHDGIASGSCPFVMPMTPDVAKAFGISTDTTGLMVGMRPPPDVFAKFKTGEYTGFSIEGQGEREAVKAAPLTAGSVVTDAAGNRFQLVPAPAADTTTATKQEPAMATKNDDMTELDELKAKYKALQEELEAEKAKSTKAEGDLEEEQKRASATPDYEGRDGTRYFKSVHGETTIALVKRVDAAEEKAEAVELQKRAETVLKHHSGSIEVRAAMMAAIDGIKDEATRKAALESMRGADAAIEPYFAPVGHSGGGGDASGNADPGDGLRKYIESTELCKSVGYDRAFASLIKTDTKVQALYDAVAAERINKRAIR